MIYKSSTPIPSFFIPVFSFLLWLIIFFDYLPVLQYDLGFSRQIVLANLYLSNIILLLAWFLCGRIMFNVFSVFFMVVSVYLMLHLREWSLVLQSMTILLIYFWLRHVTDKIENEKLEKMVERERIEERLNLSQKELEEKDQLLTALNRKFSRLKSIQEFSDHLKEATNLESAGFIIAEEVSGLITQAEQVIVYALDYRNQNLSLLAYKSKGENHKPISLRGDLYDEWVVKRSQPLLIEDSHSDFRFLTEGTRRSRYRSLIVLPLLSKSQVCGVLRLNATKVKAFQTDEFRLLDIVADLSSAVIRNIMLLDRTKELAIVDSLTDSFLLRHVQERLNEEISRASHNRASLCVLMADIDHFKRYNDEFGHTAGDIVLKSMAEVIKSVLGPNDILGRYGGEEFIILLPQKNLEQGLKAAEAIRAEVAAHNFKLRRETHKVTISIGISEFPKDGKSKEDLIWTADQRLYDAKKQGRNRVVGPTL